MVTAQVQGHPGSVFCWVAICPGATLLLCEVGEQGPGSGVHRGRSRLGTCTDKGSKSEKRAGLLGKGRPPEEAGAQER